jgi:hypothetical protein
LLVNEERNQKILELWKQGHTIEGTSILLNIPRSTVGYYYKKFGKRSKNGLLSTSEDSRARRRTVENYQVTFLALAKIISLDGIIKIMKEGDYTRSYHYLASLKLFMELWKYHKPTTEESQALVEALKTDFKPTEQRGSTIPQTSEMKGKSVSEILSNLTPKESQALVEALSNLRGKKDQPPF